MRHNVGPALPTAASLGAKMCTCSPVSGRRGTSEPPDCTACRRWHLAWAHRADLLAVARKRVVCREDADDVVNEAMLRAVQFDGLDESRIAPWMTRVVVNLCTDAERDRARAGKRRHYAVMIDMPVPSPEDVVVDRAAAVTACERLSGLPHSQREAVLLRAAGLPVAQVASELGVPYKAAESLLSRGRATLRAGLVAGAAGVLGGLRSLRRGVVPVSGMTAAALAVSVWLPGQPTAPAEAGTGGTAASPLGAALPAPPIATSMVGTHPAARSNTLRAALNRSEDRPADAAPSPAPKRAVVEPVEVRALGVTAGGVTAQEHDRPWQDELLDCLSEGELVTPEHIGCPPPDDNAAAAEGPKEGPLTEAAPRH